MITNILVLDSRINESNIDDLVGPLPFWLSEDNKEKAAQQFDVNYRHGGGWRPFGADQWELNRDTFELSYPGDPTFKPLVMMQLRDEKILVYKSSIICIIQPDGKFEVARMD